MSAGASMLLLIITTRVCGVYEAGIFSVAWVTAQMLMVVGNYGMRAYQATDLNSEFYFKDYFSSRIFTCIIMIIMSILFCMVKKYDYTKSMIIILTCIYRMVDALADVFEGAMQQKDRMDLAGKSLFYRTLFSTSAFVFILVYTKSILYSISIAILIALIALEIFCIIPSRKIIDFKLNLVTLNVKQLLIICFPLFCSCFIMSYLVNAPKYAIDSYLSEEYQTYYNIISLPAQVIYLLSNFILKPVLIKLANYWNEYMKEEFKKYVIMQSILISTLTLFVVIAGYMIGTPVLSFIYRVDITPYRRALTIILLAGGLNALSNLLYYVLTVMRLQTSVFKIYIVALVLSQIVSSLFVREGGIVGAAIGYLVVMLVLDIMMSGVVIFRYMYYK